MANTKSRFHQFLIAVRDLCLLALLGTALAAGGYFIGKTHGRTQALLELSAPLHAASSAQRAVPQTGDRK
jgi:hypothetical protein